MPATLLYKIPEIPPSNNKFIGRDVRWAYREEKQRWAELIHYFCRPRPPKPFKKATVKLAYKFSDGIRRDPDNYSGKMILDGLKSAGIIEDDSFNNIVLILCAEFKTKTKETIIEVTEIDG